MLSFETRLGVSWGGDCSEQQMWEDIETANNFKGKLGFDAYCRKLEDLPSMKENCWCNPKFAGLVTIITAAQQNGPPGKNKFTFAGKYSSIIFRATSLNDTSG